MKNDQVHEFVQACAWGDLEKVKKFVAKGFKIDEFDQKDTISVPRKDPDFLRQLSEFSKAQSTGRYRNTQRLNGVGAAMRFHQIEVLDFLAKNNADLSRVTKPADDSDKSTTAVELGVTSGFRQGVDLLITTFGQPLWTHNDRPASDLLFCAFPSVDSIHAFGPESDIENIALARAKDDHAIKSGLETINYLHEIHGLSLSALGRRGESLLHRANLVLIRGFWGDGGRIVNHLVSLGCNPSQEKMDAEEPRLKIVFSEQAKDKLMEMTGNDGDENSFDDFFGEEAEERRELFNTTPLISASFSGQLEHVRAYIKSDLADPLYKDKNGHDAFDAVRLGKKFASDEKTKSAYDAINMLLLMKIQPKSNLAAFKKPRIH